MRREGRGVEKSAEEAYFWAMNGAQSMRGEMRERALAFAKRTGARLDAETRVAVESRAQAWLARAGGPAAPATAGAEPTDR